MSDYRFPEFMRANELAKILHLKPKTLAAWRENGDGPDYIKISDGSRGAILYRGTAVASWLAARERRSTRDVASYPVVDALTGQVERVCVIGGNPMLASELGHGTSLVQRPS